MNIDDMTNAELMNAGWSLTQRSESALKAAQDERRAHSLIGSRASWQQGTSVDAYANGVGIRSWRYVAKDAATYAKIDRNIQAIAAFDAAHR